MGSLSSDLSTITFGDNNGPSLKRCTIDANDGSITTLGTGGGDLQASGQFHADRVWNAVWNDVADFQALSDRLEYGRCYFDTKEGAKICDKRCQMSVIGIASDTFGFGVGSGQSDSEVPIAVAGWVLAFVDKEYECGTPLTNDEAGGLTAMNREEKLEYPERLIALYKKPEKNEFFGIENKKIEVKGRHWVKVF